MSSIRRKSDGAAKTTPLRCRMPEALMQELKQHADEDGYDSESAYVREAIKEKIRRGEFERKLEQRVWASLNEQARRIRSLDQGQRLAFSAFTAFAKLFLLYFPEPSSLVLRDTGATLQERYRQFVADVAGQFNGEAGRDFESLTEETPLAAAAGD
jgi:Arc/MetJ-type ribon-helix-helix transcriptional regulator